MWTFYSAEASDQHYEDSLTTLATVSSIGDVDRISRDFPRPSQLEVGSDHALFKDRLRPTWEGNENGGRWMIDFRKEESAQLDNVWYNLMRAIVRNDFGSNGGDVCGIVVKIRGRVNKIGLWTNDKNNASVNREIGARIKENIRNRRIYYLGHAATSVPHRPDFMFELKR